MLQPPIDSPRGEPLPPTFQHWLDELLGGSIPREHRATCSACPMCVRPAGGRSEPSQVLFNPSAKCCTYLPELPNFLVGRVLTGDGPDGPEGPSSLRRRIAQGAGVSPLGLGMSEQYALLYKHSGDHAFGRAGSLLCPHYVDRNGGICSIWSSRNSVCSTWFCKHARGAVGQSFWSDVRRLLRDVETDLGLWCVSLMGFEAASVRLMLQHGFAGRALALADEVVASPLRTARGRVWGAWMDREEEFYRACWSAVRELTWSNVLERCGPRVGLLAAAARDGYACVTSRSLPPRLLFNPITAGRNTDSESFRVVTYSKYDPISISRDLWLVLPYFDGRPEREVREEIERREGLALDDELLTALVDYGILAAPGEETRSGDSVSTAAAG